MRNADRPEFVGLLTDALGFYGQAPSPFAIGVWWQACQCFSLEQVRKALTTHAMDPDRGHFPPRPADLVRVLQGTHADRSLMAWGKLLGAMQSVGAYTTVVFDDSAIHAAVEDMGGWQRVCRSTMDELPHVQRRFCETHRAYASRGTFPYPPTLLGAHEATNRAEGKRVEAPLLIGDPGMARSVMAGGSDVRLTVTPLAALPSANQQMLA